VEPLPTLFEVDQSTVSRDLKAIQRQWKESAIRDFDLDRQQELQWSMLRRNIGRHGERSAVKRDFFNERLATGKDELGNL